MILLLVACNTARTPPPAKSAYRQQREKFELDSARSGFLSKHMRENNTEYSFEIRACAYQKFRQDANDDDWNNVIEKSDFSNYDNMLSYCQDMQDKRKTIIEQAISASAAAEIYKCTQFCNSDCPEGENCCREQIGTSFVESTNDPKIYQKVYTTDDGMQRHVFLYRTNGYDDFCLKRGLECYDSRFYPGRPGSDHGGYTLEMRIFRDKGQVLVGEGDSSDKCFIVKK